MSSAARLQKELKESQKNPTEGIKVDLPDENNLYLWHVYIKGPPDTGYEGGIFKLEMTFPKDYPNSPPDVKFISDMWHPNVYPDGRVCISILHTPDPMNPQESSDECWRPIHTYESIVMSIISMLADPNISSPANIDASKEYRDKPKDFKQHASKLADKSKKALPTGFEMPKPRKPVKSPEVDDMLDETWDLSDENEEPEDEDEGEPEDEPEEED